MRLVIFVDGENFRKSLDHLFNHQDFPTRSWNFLPPADWSTIFLKVENRITAVLGNVMVHRVRTYWYVSTSIHWDRHHHTEEFVNKDVDHRFDFLTKRYASLGGDLSNVTSPARKGLVCDRIIKALQKHESDFQKRSQAQRAQFDAIASSTNRLQIQDSGYVRGVLGKGSIIDQKGADVRLAVDMLDLVDTYDVAALISGDGDFVPAVDAVKRRGKTVVFVGFEDVHKQAVRGSSTALVRASDYRVSVPISDLAPCLLGTAWSS